MRRSFGRCTSPVSGSCVPMRISMSVVLPSPLPPTSAWRRPGSRRSDTSRNSRRGPNDFESPDAVSTGGEGTVPDSANRCPALRSPAMDEAFAAWLATTVEEPLDPELMICDPHHHLWDHPKERFLVEELKAETGAGHNVTETVFVDCMSGYRTDGPVEMAPVGE